jgi:hypothetical protein
MSYALSGSNRKKKERYQATRSEENSFSAVPVAVRSVFSAISNIIALL